MKTRALLLSLTAGLAGGVISHSLVPTLVLAQTQNSAPSEIRGQRFVLVNDKGEVGGIFAFDGQGRPIIQLFEKGHQVWSAGGNPLHPLASR